MSLPNRAALALIGLFLTTQASATAYDDHGMQVVAKLPMDQFKSDLVFHNAPCRIGRRLPLHDGPPATDGGPARMLVL